MSADLHIHIATPNITDEHFKCFFSNTLGSKWFSMSLYNCEDKVHRDIDYNRTCKQFNEEYHRIWKTIPELPKEEQDRWSELLEEHYKRVGYECRHHSDIYSTPNIWVGEVSWIKA